MCITQTINEVLRNVFEYLKHVLNSHICGPHAQDTCLDSLSPLSLWERKKIVLRSNIKISKQISNQGVNQGIE